MLGYRLYVCARVNKLVLVRVRVLHKVWSILLHKTLDLQLSLTHASQRCDVMTLLETPVIHVRTHSREHRGARAQSEERTRLQHEDPRHAHR